VTRHKPRAPQLPEVVSEPDLSGPTALSFSEQRAVSSSVCFPLSKQKGLDNQNNESKLQRNISVLPINASAASFSRFFLWARSLFCCCRADILDLPWLGVPTSASFGAPGFGGRNSITGGSVSALGYWRRKNNQSISIPRPASAVPVSSFRFCPFRRSLL
jgi:hypothetical protein